jgi:hypothetical protein
MFLNQGPYQNRGARKGQAAGMPKRRVCRDGMLNLLQRTDWCFNHFTTEQGSRCVGLTAPCRILKGEDYGERNQQGPKYSSAGLW